MCRRLHVKAPTTSIVGVGVSNVGVGVGVGVGEINADVGEINVGAYIHA